MSGFDTAKVDAAFFPDGKVRGISNFLVNLLLILSARAMARLFARENPESPPGTDRSAFMVGAGILSSRFRMTTLMTSAAPRRRSCPATGRTRWTPRPDGGDTEKRSDGARSRISAEPTQGRSRPSPRHRLWQRGGDGYHLVERTSAKYLLA